MTQETNEENIVGVRPDADYSGVPSNIGIEDGKAITTIGTATTGSHTVQPAAGELWLIKLIASFLHTGTTGTRISIYLTDGTDDILLKEATNSDIDLFLDKDVLISNSYYLKIEGNNPDTGATHDLITEHVGERVR